MWWENINDVTEEDVLNIVRLYNDFVRVHDTGYRYYIKVTKNFSKHKNYGDAISLFRLILSLNTTPREYLSAQFMLYKAMKKHPYSRQLPTLKNLSSPAAVKRWNDYLLATGKKEMPSVKLTDEDIIKYNEFQLKKLMESWNISNEKDFFKDVILANQFPLEFLQRRATFRELVREQYYENTYSVKDYKEIFVV